MDKIQAFPPLPQKQMTVLPAGSALPRSMVVRDAAPIKGRIVYSKKSTRPTTDPSKNPLSLLPGFSNLSVKSGSSSSISSSSSIGKKTKSTSPVVKRDEQDYPSLTPPKAKPTQPSSPMEDEEDTFVIGHSSLDNINDNDSSNQGATGKKKKWKPVLHIGL